MKHEVHGFVNMVYPVGLGELHTIPVSNPVFFLNQNTIISFCKHLGFSKELNTGD